MKIICFAFMCLLTTSLSLEALSPAESQQYCAVRPVRTGSGLEDKVCKAFCKKMVNGHDGYYCDQVDKCKCL
ncbi:hypothetical protein JTB14_029586 [Gonioctena quinquepunctata]|nr:hypothetical protein JTB14_029586 [Gonioctena quinquepunctata]